MSEVIPPARRAGAVAQRLIEERLGEPVETINRVIWPDPELPEIVERWLDRYLPDVVHLRAASYWVTYESVPLRLRRKGRLGVLADIGAAAGARPRFASTASFRVVRRAAVRLIGGDTYFTPEEAAGTVAATLRRIVMRESLVTVVRGPFRPFNSSGTRAGHLRAEHRYARFESSLLSVCGELRVPYLSMGNLFAGEPPLPDEVHGQEGTHAKIGKLEGEAIVHAVLELRR